MTAEKTEHEGLVVLPTHRLVRDLADFDKEKLLNDCKEYFDITEEKDINTAESKLKKLYIADGHHRYETALNYRNYCHENNIGDGGENFTGA